MFIDEDAWLMWASGTIVRPTAMPQYGRRLRVLHRLRRGGREVPIDDFMEKAEALRWLADPYSNLSLRTSYDQMLTAIPEGKQPTANAALNPALRDLSYEILEDIQEAAEWLGNPNLYYAGVDEGIEPVTDEHVELVMWAMQRELDREPRPSRVPSSGAGYLPPVQLATFPWRIQRALAERRRLRYQQWGIGKKQWEENAWSLWEVPLDESYESRREARGLEERNDAQ